MKSKYFNLTTESLISLVIIALTVAGISYVLYIMFDGMKETNGNGNTNGNRNGNRNGNSGMGLTADQVFAAQLTLIQLNSMGIDAERAADGITLGELRSMFPALTDEQKASINALPSSFSGGEDFPSASPNRTRDPGWMPKESFELTDMERYYKQNDQLIPKNSSLY